MVANAMALDKLAPNDFESGLESGFVAPKIAYPIAMTQRIRTFSGAPWEQMVGYCRAVRVGQHVAVSGTAPVSDNGTTFAPGDPYRQARRCLDLIETALSEVDATMTDVIRTRMFVTDISLWKEFGRAHAERFADFPPATSMIEVSQLIDSEMLIEIEVDAICTGSPGTITMERDDRTRI